MSFHCKPSDSEIRSPVLRPNSTSVRQESCVASMMRLASSAVGTYTRRAGRTLMRFDLGSRNASARQSKRTQRRAPGRTRCSWRASPRRTLLPRYRGPQSRMNCGCRVWLQTCEVGGRSRLWLRQAGLHVLVLGRSRAACEEGPTRLGARVRGRAEVPARSRCTPIVLDAADARQAGAGEGCHPADARDSGSLLWTGRDGSFPAARTHCPTDRAEASAPTRQETTDRLDGNSAGLPAVEAPRARDARRVSRPRSRPLTDTATPTSRVET
jgi:hypothetical protein